MTADDLERAIKYRNEAAFLGTRAELPTAEVFIDSGPMIPGSCVSNDFIEGLRTMDSIPAANKGPIAWHATDLVDYIERWSTL